LKDKIMKTNKPALVAVLASVAISALGTTASRAQTTSAAQRPAFSISEFELTDLEGIKPYSARVDATFAPFGGRYVVRGGQIAPLEGEAPKGRIVMIAFPSMERAQAWYNSPAYREIMPIRHKTTKSRVFIVEGTAD
jgi:uncharacterized protein (DUF1330 family)